MSVLEARQLSKRFGERVALDDVSFAVERAEIVGVLGPNGAGKTTAIRILTTVLQPTSGRFAVAGLPMERAAAIRRVVGVVPESSGYPERLTGDEYVRYHARLAGQSRASAAASARELLAEVGLADRSRSRIAAYSRGMRQRLGIARALVHEPLVVFLDEPTLGLDPAGQRQVLELVQRIARERGATILLCTHLLAEVEHVCSRVLIVQRGRLIADGTVAEVIRRAAAPRQLRLRVEADHVDGALRALRGTPAVAEAVAGDGASGALRATLAGPAGADANAALVALTDASVPVVSFELEGARLDDAFLALTEGA